MCIYIIFISKNLYKTLSEESQVLYGAVLTSDSRSSAGHQPKLRHHRHGAGVEKVKVVCSC